MSTVIASVDHRSPAQRAGIRPGEKLLTINGHEIEKTGEKIRSMFSWIHE